MYIFCVYIIAHPGTHLYCIFVYYYYLCIHLSYIYIENADVCTCALVLFYVMSMSSPDEAHSNKQTRSNTCIKYHIYGKYIRIRATYEYACTTPFFHPSVIRFSNGASAATAYIHICIYTHRTYMHLFVCMFSVSMFSYSIAYYHYYYHHYYIHTFISGKDGRH